MTITTVGRDGRLELHVHNTGAPIPKELEARIFEPLQRGEQAAGRKARSVGLGLYIVKQIAAAHGGSVDLRSNEAEGTTFVVSLPRGSADSVSA